MIKRIKQLKNIGTFSDFVSNPPIQLDKLTFIYGLNTYGKTTLTDIFRSIKTNDFSILESRKSIPSVSFNQNVVLSYKNDDQQKEQEIKVNNNTWENNKLHNHIEIFSSEFIHENLFTGLSIERANKENFTQFILGDTGVGLAKEIKELSQKLNKLKRELPNKRPNFVKNSSIQEVQNFININIDAFNIEDLRVQYSSKYTELKAEQEKLKEPQVILSKPTPQEIIINSYQAENIIKNINAILSSGFQNISEEALAKVNQHISLNFKDHDKAENWIKTGKDNLKDESCSFCGQKLENAKDLIDAYNQFFNEKYNHFVNELESNFSKHKSLLASEKFDLKSKITNNINKAKSFNDIAKVDLIDHVLEDIIELSEKLQQEEVERLRQNTLNECEKLFEQKQLKPHKAVDPYDATNFIDKIQEYINTAIKINVELKKVTELIVEYKEKYNDLGKLQEELRENETAISKIDINIKRIEQNTSCELYRTSEAEINSLQEDIAEKETNLETNQTSYLTSYYTKIDSLFKQFGSKNFTLEKASSNRGNQPVYSLKVKFHNQDINEKDFAKVFSESDKRALALAVFWTKIELLSAEEKAETILVLDDPVTSFDENRISKSINLFKDALKELAQVVVLTHYPSFIKRFFEITHKGQSGINFLEIQRKNQSSVIKRCDIDKIVKSDYHQAYEKITGYINGEHENCIKSELRKFLETAYLPHFYPHKFRQAKLEGVDISSLGDRIDYIFSDQVEVKNKFHFFRENTNPEAHIYTSNNIEDVKSFADDMMNYLYSVNYN